MLNSAGHQICPANESQITIIANSFLLNIAEQENFSANKYENTYLLLTFSYLLAKKMSCSAELNVKKNKQTKKKKKKKTNKQTNKKRFYTFGPDAVFGALSLLLR